MKKKKKTVKKPKPVFYDRMARGGGIMTESEEKIFVMIVLKRMNDIVESVPMAEVVVTPVTEEVDRFLTSCKIDLKSHPPLVYVLGAATGWIAGRRLKQTEES